MTFVGTDVFLRDVLEEHYEMLDFLWMQRRNNLRSPDITRRDLVDSDERIAAHTDGLVLAGPDGMAIAAPGLESGEGSFSLASGYVLLATGTASAAGTVVAVMQDAPAEARDGLRLALCYGPIEHSEADLRAAFNKAPAPAAVVAAEALAFHGRFADPGTRLVQFADDADPGVRAAAWRVIALAAAGGAERSALLDRSSDLERAMADSDEGVRAAAIEAAAWSRQPWLLDHCRRVAEDASSPVGEQAARLFAILGAAADLDLMRAIGTDRARGPARFDLLASFGHPALLDLIVDGFDPARPEDAAAAGVAFKRMTGLDVGSGTRVVVPPDTAPDAFEREFLDEVELPDAERARALLDRVRDKIAGLVRIARGFDVGPTAATDVLDSLDLRSRSEAALRLAWASRFKHSPAWLDRFPSR